MVEIDPEMKEVADDILPPNDLPEAPASVTARFWIEDYGVLLTMRGREVKEVVKKLEWVIDFAKKKGWRPRWSEGEEKKAQKAPAACSHTQFKVKQVKKEGANKGKWFKTCAQCGEFLGWVKV